MMNDAGGPEGTLCLANDDLSKLIPEGYKAALPGSCLGLIQMMQGPEE
jgi:hypothetical protein